MTFQHNCECNRCESLIEENEKLKKALIETTNALTNINRKAADDDNEWYMNVSARPFLGTGLQMFVEQLNHADKGE